MRHMAFGQGDIDPGLSHLVFCSLSEECGEEGIVPSGAFELAFHGSFGGLSLGEIEREPAQERVGRMFSCRLRRLILVQMSRAAAAARKPTLPIGHRRSRGTAPEMRGSRKSFNAMDGLSLSCGSAKPRTPLPCVRA